MLRHQFSEMAFVNPREGTCRVKAFKDVEGANYAVESGSVIGFLALFDDKALVEAAVECLVRRPESLAYLLEAEGGAGLMGGEPEPLQDHAEVTSW